MDAIRRLLNSAAGGGYVERESLQRPLIAGWLLSLPVAWFASGYLSRLYPAWAMPIVMLLLLSLLGMCGVWILRRLPHAGLSTASWLTLAAAGGFAFAIVSLCLRYPALFDRSLFLPERTIGIWFVFLACLAPVVSAWTLRAFDEHESLRRLRNLPWLRFAHENLPGLLVSILFFIAYLALSHTFNRPGSDTTENFFAADNFTWLARLAAPTGTQIEMRAVHPFAYLIFRPAVWMFSLLFNGDRTAAALWLVPLMGGVCVLLTWVFIHKWSGSTAYALLWASLLGVSTTHLLFASIVETYIFSAALLLLFFLLLLNEKTSLFSLVLVGAMTFGLTITNFIQTFIGFAVARPKLKAIFIYGLLASALSIGLTLLHAGLYPSALVFFLPQDAAVENEYSISIIGQPAWRLVGRAALLIRNIFLYSVVAPEPFVQTHEVGGAFPRFNFFKISPGSYSYSAYDGLGQALIMAWALVLLVAAALFAWNLIRFRKLDLGLALAVCLLFNFALHMGYGFEPFLYAADWTYALILFVAVSLSRFADDKRLQAGLLIFLGLLMINQWVFLRLIFDRISPFFQ